MQMRNLIFRVVLFFLTIPLFAQGLSKVTIANVNLRKGPSIDNDIICTIPKATTLTVDSLNNDAPEWLRVNYCGKIGYVYSKYLSGHPLKSVYSKTQESVTTSSGVKYYTNSQGVKVQSPTYYSSPPLGATAECWDGTYSFSHSRRGTCSHHGGVKRWL